MVLSMQNLASASISSLVPTRKVASGSNQPFIPLALWCAVCGVTPFFLRSADQSVPAPPYIDRPRYACRLS